MPKAEFDDPITKDIKIDVDGTEYHLFNRGGYWKLADADGKVKESNLTRVCYTFDTPLGIEGGEINLNNPLPTYMADRLHVESPRHSQIYDKKGYVPGSRRSQDEANEVIIYIDGQKNYVKTNDQGMISLTDQNGKVLMGDVAGVFYELDGETRKVNPKSTSPCFANEITVVTNDDFLYKFNKHGFVKNSGIALSKGAEEKVKKLIKDIEKEMTKITQQMSEEINEEIDSSAPKI